MALSFQSKVRPVGTTTPTSQLSFASKVRPVTTPSSVPAENGSMVGNFVKGLVSAPATLIARPFQAAADLGDYIGTEMAKKGQSPEVQAAIIADSNARQKEKQTKSTFGGVVAPTPATFKDVKKDVGRGFQTVALGTGAPITGGAMFGVGASLEQGNDLLSAETALQAVIGASAGKVLDLVGKPLLDATGRVIGTITPQILKDVATKGAGAVEQFMARHEIVPAAVKPAINAIPEVAQNIDTGVNKLFKSTGTAIKEGIQSQYPGLKKENIAKHYEDVEMDRLFKPTKESGTTYRKAADVAKEAQRKGIDLKQVAKDNKIYPSDHVVDGKYDTKDVVDALRSETASGGPEILRPALREASPSVERVPISEIRTEMARRITSAPDAKISPEQKKTFLEAIKEEYGDGSITARKYVNGYDLENLYDSKLQTSSKLYRPSKTGGLPTHSDSLTNQRKKIESWVFNDFLRARAPKELGLDQYFKTQQSRFALADYLLSLNGKKAPQTLFQRGVRRASQLAGATTGANVAGPFGMFSGYQFGGVVADTFAGASNPVKIAYLKSIGKTTPEIYSIMKNYVSEAEAARLVRVLLPEAAGNTTAPDLMKMQNKGGAVEMGYPFRETTAKEKVANDILQNSRRLFNTKELPAPEARIVTPNTQGTPNRIDSLYNAGGDLGETGGMRQRIPAQPNPKIGSFFSPEEKSALTKRAEELTRRNGGVTINLKGDVPTQGFAYSPYKDTETKIIKENFSDTDIDNFIEKYYDRLIQEGHHLGAWEDNGTIYLDISKVNPDENAAVADALANDQLALFDLSTFETKFMKDYEKINNTYRHKGQK